jgi:hypothetical protein
MRDKFLPLLCAFSMFFCSCEERPALLLNSDGNDYVQSFEWSYKDRQFTFEIHVPQCIYDHYHSLPRDLPYQAYAIEDPRYPYLDSIVTGLCRIAAPLHLSEREMDQFIMDFCQSIPYKLQPLANASPRFAVETLVEKRQICSDVSILCVTLLSMMNRHTCLFYIPGAQHMAAGVSVPGLLSSYYMGKTGIRYAFVECTTPGWKLGDCSCPDDSAVMSEISPAYPQSRYIKRIAFRLGKNISSLKTDRP